MSKIGVFVCHCGENIGATVDCEKVAAEAAKIEGVEVSVDYKYMCSDPGQTMIKDAIREKGLDGVVVAACSPRMHETTFRKACSEACMNPYMCEIANIREHCSWVHEKGDATTESAPMGRAMIFAAFSAAFMPMRLGTSSPKMIVR